MSMHDAQFVSQLRRAQGTGPRGPLLVTPSVQHGTDLQQLKSLPWPRNLFGEHATIAELLAPEDGGVQCIASTEPKHSAKWKATPFQETSIIRPRRLRRTSGTECIAG